MKNAEFIGSMFGEEKEYNLGDVRSRVQVAIIAIKEGKTQDALRFLSKAETILDSMIAGFLPTE
jgi:hypothetical protein